MCRWLAYTGAPVFLEDLICKPVHSLVDQSLCATEAKSPTNGDGSASAGTATGRSRDSIEKFCRPGTTPT